MAKEKHSKPYQTFCNRVLHLDADLELIDIIDSSVKSGLLFSEDKLFSKISKNKHPVLSKRKVTSVNRELAINHLKQSMFSSYIKDLYEEVYDYLKSVLFEASINAKIEPSRFIGDQKIEIKAKDILQADKLQTLVKEVVEELFRKLENKRSTKDLIENICNRLDISVENGKKEKALYYLEVRHQLVHADGKADEAFRKAHPDIPYKDGYIDLRYRLIISARKAIKEFITSFDTQLIIKGLITPQE